MNFRQRIAWLIVACYLTLTCAMLYYIFEISDAYNAFALDHVALYHASVNRESAGGGGGGGDGAQQHQETPVKIVSAARHLSDIPIQLWILLLVLPYLQVFCILLACTKPQPQFSMAYLWPIFVYLKVRNVYKRLTVPSYKAVNSPVCNGHGHILIDT